MALVISPDGSSLEVRLVSGLALNDQVHTLIGGWFEVIGLGDGLYLVYDELAIRRCKPYNEQATLLARGVLRPGHVIAGVALAVSRYELGM